MRRHSQESARPDSPREERQRARAAHESTLWRLRATAVDAPGALTALAKALARQEVDILALQAHPVGERTVDEFLLRAPSYLSGATLTEAVSVAGGSATWLKRADAHELLGTPAGASDTAARNPQRPEVPDVGPISVRHAASEDLAAATALHARCSERTLATRYHGPPRYADRHLPHLLSPRFGHTLAAENEAGQLVALGHLLWDGEESEVALLVEDAWQRRGVGARLLRPLVGLAAEAGCEHVYAVVQAANTGMIATMRGLGLPLDYQFEGDTVVISTPLAAAPAPAERRR